MSTRAVGARQATHDLRESDGDRAAPPGWQAAGTSRNREEETSAGAAQLELFPEASCRPSERGRCAVDFSISAAPPEVREVMSGQPEGLHQVDLFHARYLHLQHARHLVARGHLALACSAYARLVRQYPDDLVLADEAHGIDALRAMFADALILPEDARWSELLVIAEQLDRDSDMLSALRRLVLRYIATEARRVRGEDVEVAGHPLAYLWIEAGLLDEAEMLLAGAYHGASCARDVFLRADLHLLRGEHGAARACYRRALLLDPYHAYFERIRDQEIRALPDVARFELEIEDEPRAWSAAAGMVTGVLPLGPDACDMRATDLDAGSPRSEALAHARAFAAALMEASTARARGDQSGVVAARRAMRQLAPTLLAAYLERMDGGGVDEERR
jgi:tetratricopeptide (TPR) repeat protein